MKKKTNSILTGILLTSLVLSGTYNPIESKSLLTHRTEHSLETVMKIPLKEKTNSIKNNLTKNTQTKNNQIKNDSTENILVLYYEDFYAFGTLKKNVEEINSEYEKITNKKVHCEYVLFEENIRVKNSKKAIKENKEIDFKIQNEMNDFVQKNGSIDKLIIGFHMSENEIILPLITTPNNKDIYTPTLTTQEMKQIASQNKESEKLFSKNAQTIFYACSSARGEKSFAEEFSKSYRVNTIGANQSYQGRITCDKKGNYELTSKTNQQSNIYAQILKSPQGTIYLREENSDYLLDTVHDEVVSFEELLVNSEIKIINDSLFSKGMDEFDIDLKLKSCGFKIVEKGMIDNYMTMKKFYGKGK